MVFVGLGLSWFCLFGLLTLFIVLLKCLFMICWVDLLVSGLIGLDSLFGD